MSQLIFSRQSSYDDLAYYIHALIYELQINGIAGVEGLQILDLAYRGHSKTYKNFSDKYGKRFRAKLNQIVAACLIYFHKKYRTFYHQINFSLRLSASAAALPTYNIII